MQLFLGCPEAQIDAPKHKSHLSISHNHVTIFHGRNTMTQSSRSIRAAIVAVLAAGSMMTIGCTGPAVRSDSKLTSAFQKPKWLKAPWSKSEDEMPEPYPNPVKIASTWTPDVLVQTGRTPTRGFGGRLFFFDEKTKAVPVEGTLTVHGFELDSRPERKLRSSPSSSRPSSSRRTLAKVTSVQAIAFGFRGMRSAVTKHECRSCQRSKRRKGNWCKAARRQSSCRAERKSSRKRSPVAYHPSTTDTAMR